jgi:hypothetical protein
MRSMIFSVVISIVLALIGTSQLGGLATTTAIGTDVTEVIGPGASEGEIVAKHGPADQVVPLGTPWFSPQTGESSTVDKCLYVYRIERRSSILGAFSRGERTANICYLVSNGRVQGGGYVASGSSKSTLGAPSWFSAILALCGLGLLGLMIRGEHRCERVAAAVLATIAAGLFGWIVPLSLAVTLVVVFSLWQQACGCSNASTTSVPSGPAT